MNELRKFLGALFGFTAFSCASIALSPFFRALNARQPSLAVHALLTSLFVVLFMIACSILNGLACWAVLMNRRSARILGIAASTLPFLGMAVITILPWLLIHRSSMPPPFLICVTSGLAIAGLLAFLPRNSRTPAAAKPPTPIPGDGTNQWVGKFIWIIGTVGFLFALNWWWHWAQIQGLHSGGGTLFLQLVLADLVIVLLHELGHTITGLALGMKLHAFIVGPFQWRMQEGNWEFKLQPGGFFSTGGTTGLVPTNPRLSVWEQACMGAAGPFASLVSGAIALCAALTAPGEPWEPAWFLLACVATLSLIVGVLNLVPFQTGTAYSDGAQIYQLLSGGPWADYHRAIAVVTSTLVTPLRPRDFDIEAINRAATAISAGTKGMLLHLYATSYYVDRGQLREAADAFRRAEQVYHASTLDIPAPLHTAFIIDKALLHHDAVGARQWWDRMEAKKPTRFNVDYWLARAALLWIEKNLQEAHSALEKAENLAQKLPQFGAYEFDRYRCALLRKALDESSPSLASQPLSDTTAAPA